MKSRLTVLILLLLSLFPAMAGCGFAAIPASAGADDLPVFVIDAGHGGEDGGAVSTDGKTIEKDINLQIALKVRDLLAAYGLKTVMTRTDDRSIHDDTAKTVRQKKVSDIHNRLDLLEGYDNAVLVSIHQNKFSESQSKGTQVFFSPNNPQSQILADEIQGAVRNLLQNDNSRLTKKSGSSIYILYNATKPAVMVECGFLSNPADTKSLKQEDYQRRLAFSIVAGILNYMNIKTDEQAQE
ncbi:MAG: N-acetylmuramoyl-L-alanine amidase [Oscillospiraceae bacterium]|jgi:N-acetylmuramoyl-L-alanine amidase|nr:N-acetylmuramoyl-L-alanine amidase [Oscillospiraceae bacterium]